MTAHPRPAPDRLHSGPQQYTGCRPEPHDRRVGRRAGQQADCPCYYQSHDHGDCDHDDDDHASHIAALDHAAHLDRGFDGHEYAQPQIFVPRQRPE